MAISIITALLITTATLQVALGGSIVGYSPNYCTPPSVLQYGGYRPNNAYFSVGSKIEYYCDDGYDLYGYGTSTCIYDPNTKLAHFSYNPPVCKRIKCPHLESPKYGRVVITEDYPHSALATYSCDRHYEIVGVSTRKCHGGIWIGEAPICKPIRCPLVLNPKHGKVIVTGNYDHDSIATFVCNKYYVLDGPSTKKCLKGKWVGKTPICKPISCPELENPDNGKVVITGEYYSGSTATYKCNKYYVLTGLYTRQCVHGKWEGKAPTCEPLRCPKLSHPEYGRVNIVGEYLHDSVATYSCIKGYEVYGTPTLKCVYGRWEGNTPQCLPINYCPMLDDPEYGQVYVSRGSQYGVAQILQTIIHTIVQDKYLQKVIRKEIGDYNISSYDDLYKMLETKELVTPKGLSLIQLVFKRVDSFSTATYSCERNYKLKGSSTRRCYYGLWDGDEPTCEPITCPYLPNPKYGKVVITGKYYHDSTATYYCNKGYVIYGESSRKCIYGEWEGKSPVCKPAPVPKKCPPLPDLAYGKVEIVGGYYHNSVATYSCDKDFKLYGADTRRCQHGVWNGKAPVCKHYGPPVVPKRCRLLAAPDYGSVYATSNTIGAISHYQCTAGYKLVGSSTRKCLSNGKWEGEAPECKPVDCGPLVQPEYGYVKYDNIYYQSTAYYSCQSGYELTTSSNFRICQANGYWSGPVPLCSHAY